MSFRFSQNLERTLGRAYEVASQQGRKDATPEDLLIALIDDPDATAVLQAARVDAERLRRDLAGYMEGARDEAAGDASEAPKPSPELQQVVQTTATHALSVGRETITGVDVLVILLSQPAGHFLQQQGMTRYDATRFISHGIVGEANATPADLPTGGTAEVRMLNDDYTPMEFVVRVLEDVFAMDYDTACRVMLHIHAKGVSTCGTFPADVARAKVAEVLATAREHQHPLQCVLVQRDH
jgi:ATP-dependent Clp protease adapter protein ClpS/histone H3/H4